MKKKLFSLLCTLMCAGNLFAYDFYVDGIYYNKLGGDSVEVTYKTYRNSSYSGSVAIPETVTYSNTTYRVTTIGECAFQKCHGLTSVTIPNSVTTIGMGAFDYCSGLTSVTIGNSVTTIGNNAFSICSGLTSVTIPNSVTTIGEDAFWDCSGLTSVTIPNSVTTIGSSAFKDCSGLTSVTIPNSVTTIGKGAFAGVNNIIYSGTVPGSPWGAKCANGYIDGYLVYSDATKTTLCGCSTAATGEIVIPSSVTTIGEDAFRKCHGLTSIIIPNSVTTIGEDVFWDCSGLTSVTIPNSVTTIGSSAFKYCSGLTSVTIGNSVTTIGSSAFSGCSGLTSVTIGNSVTMVGDYAFDGCKYLVDIYCYAPMPPAAQSSSFANYNVFLHVPCDNLRVYQTDIVFGSFKYIECISAEEKPVTGDEVTVNPSADNVTITWPANDNASEYKLVIIKDGIVFCTLTFNAQGQLTGIAFAPNRAGSRMLDAAVMTANGWQFTVTGLDQASKYGYTIDALNASKQSIKHYEGEFATDGYTSLEWVTSDKIQSVNKMLLDGHLYILRDGNLFTATGARVK